MLGVSEKQTRDQVSVEHREFPGALTMIRTLTVLFWMPEETIRAPRAREWFCLICVLQGLSPLPSSTAKGVFRPKAKWVWFGREGRR